MSKRLPDAERENPDWLSEPIPIGVGDVEDYAELPIKENGEPLVAIGPFAGNDYDRLLTDSLYAGERENSPYPPESLEGSLVTTFMREGTSERIRQAEELLPEGYHVVVWDAFRTLEVQGSLYDFYRAKLAELHPDWDDEQLDAGTVPYVSKPSRDSKRPATHNTGGAVDLDIIRIPTEAETRIQEIDRRIFEIGDSGDDWEEVYELERERQDIFTNQAEPLEFGAVRDYGDKQAAADYFERLSETRSLTPEELEARDNRRMLYNVMERVGMQPLASEYWHYNDENTQMGSRVAGQAEASYGRAWLSKDNLTHELMRRQHLSGAKVYAEDAVATELGDSELDTLLKKVASETAHPRQTTLPEAAVIQPEDVS
ncbi:MAG: hypothetical protein Q8Q11_01200 [bacterium]|nr:hypothetical protein [bacterium]MDZ4248105.1 hypothetical protein [Patescibacteria group bacterium]